MLIFQLRNINKIDSKTKEEHKDKPKEKVKDQPIVKKQKIEIDINPVAGKKIEKEFFKAVAISESEA